MTGSSAGDDPHRRRRAEYRAFVREHHPDRGGDPAVFVAGLARFRAEGAVPGGAAETVPAGAAETVPAGEPLDDPRFDAPIEFTRPLPLPTRVAVALIRTIRRHRQRTLD